MARYIGPVCRLCRRAGEKLFLKGERCFTPRCGVEKRNRPPGARSSRPQRPSDWGTQMREKQKARQIYGVLERQFLGYIKKAQQRPGATGQYLMQLLERRLDNVIYRLGIADSRQQARQLVTHGHLKVNGRKTNIPSYLVKPGDSIAWKESSAQRDFFKGLTQGVPKRTVPSWLSLDPQNMVAKMISLPEPTDIDTKIETRLIVEFYSR